MLAQETAESKMEHQKIENATYTCPMHADVKSDKPGDCPKCGMALKIMDAKKAVTKHCDMPKKGSCCPKESDASTKTAKKSGCIRTKEEKSNKS